MSGGYTDWSAAPHGGTVASKAAQSRKPLSQRSIQKSCTPMAQILVSTLGAVSKPLTLPQRVTLWRNGFLPSAVIANTCERPGLYWHRNSPNGVERTQYFNSLGLLATCDRHHRLHNLQLSLHLLDVLLFRPQGRAQLPIFHFPDPRPACRRCIQPATNTDRYSHASADRLRLARISCATSSYRHNL